LSSLWDLRISRALAGIARDENSVTRWEVGLEDSIGYLPGLR
jgi:hypothetical protein